MRVNQKKEYYVHHLRYVVRSAIEKDAKNLSEVRLQIDGEVEWIRFILIIKDTPYIFGLVKP